MADFKQHKENENKIHEQLYGNLFLLSQLYPTSKDFNTVFKKDMFVKNNRAAFFEVIYYLLNILNPELTKEKLTSWPPYDIKRENKFRTEILKYVNELNVLYDNCDIPHIMSSHLISPGGMKFTKFMLKLSQLVMYEHLRRTQDVNILYCPKPSKNVSLSKINLSNIKKKTEVIEQETNNMVKSFHNFHFDSNEKALSLNKELTQLNDNIRLAKKENETVREDFNKNHPNYPLHTTLEQKIRSLKCQYEGVQEIYKMIYECENILSYLNSSDLVLEHSKEKLKLPNNILDIVKHREELDLIEFFEGLIVLLEEESLEFPYLTNSFVNKHMEKIDRLNKQYEDVKTNLSENFNEFQGVLQKISEKLKVAIEEDKTNETEEILALPLNDTLKSQ